MTRVAAVVAGEVVLFFVLVIALLALYPFEDSTLWQPGYREPAFRAIQVGDTKAHVLATVGPPLNAYWVGRQGSGPWYRDHWSYTAPGRKAGSCAFHVRQLTFRGDRVVVKEAYYIGD